MHCLLLPILYVFAWLAISRFCQARIPSIHSYLFQLHGGTGRQCCGSEKLAPALLESFSGMCSHRLNTPLLCRYG